MRRKRTCREPDTLRKKTIKELEKPIVPESLYIKFGNEEWNRLCEENKVD